MVVNFKLVSRTQGVYSTNCSRAANISIWVLAMGIPRDSGSRYLTE